jgi:uncharacterized integral membrane protein
MTRLLIAIVMILGAAALVAFAVANRTSVNVSFDPFEPTDPAYTVNLPLWIVSFVVLCVGVAIGGIVSWFSEGKRRRHRRRLEAELARVRAEFDRAKREAASREVRAPAAPQTLPVRLPAN